MTLIYLHETGTVQIPPCKGEGFLRPHPSLGTYGQLMVTGESSVIFSGVVTD